MDFKYRILARRDAREEWTDWNTTNDPNEIRAKLEHVERCGYEAMVEDTKLKYWEREHARGYLRFIPAKVGDFRYILYENGAESYIEKYKVGLITFDGKKWYVTREGTNEQYEEGCDYCLRLGIAKSRLKAILKEYKD